MMLDALNLFSDDQDLSQAAGTYLSDKSIFLGDINTDVLGNTPPQDIGRGVPVQVLCQITETVDSVEEDATVEAQLVMADNEALDSNLVVLQSTGAIAEATLVAGYQFRLGGTIPPGITKAYIGMRYLVAVHTTTAGKITAGIVETKDTGTQV